MAGPWEDYKSATPTAPAAKSADGGGPWEDYGGTTPALSEGTTKPLDLKAAAARSVKDIPAIADMVLGLPGMGLQLGAEALGRLHGVIEGGLAGITGKDPQGRKRAEAYGLAAKESVPEGFTAPFQTLLKTFGLDASGSNLESVMGTAMTALHKGGEFIQKITKDAVSAADADLITNTLMFAAGGKGVGGQLKKALEPKPPEGQFKGPYEGKLDPPKPEPPEPPKPREPPTGFVSNFEPNWTDPTEFKARGVRTPEGGPSNKTPAQIAAESKALKKDARQRYKDDPDWADYLKRTADYEAEQRATIREESARLTPEEMAPRTRTADKTAVDESARTLEANQFGDLTAKEPTSLDSGLAKIARGRSFDLTALERAAVNKSGSSWNRPGIVLPAVLAATGLGLALRFGGEDKDSLATAAAVGGALLIGKGKGLTMDEIAGHMDSAPLKTFLDQSAYTLNTLEKLPPNRFQFTKQSIEELLKRPEVTQAERDVFRGVLDKDPQARDITAKQLMQGVKEATGDWEMTKAPTDRYADYGLESIDRALAPETFDNEPWIPADATPVEEARLREEHRVEVQAQIDGAPKATTSIWQLPEHMEMSNANHFKDPRYFGHTRSFEEGGVRHVVEIQSDLAQKAGKVLSEEERTRLEGERDRAQARIEAALDPSNPARRDPATMAAVRSYRVAQAEANAKLANAGKGEKVEPLLKNWHKRLVREELADAAKNGEGNVRFATADTVAKVEGWPERNYTNATPEEFAKGGQFNPEHQGIYDRYKKDVEKFLTQLGGKPHTDSAGHTWIEVPVEGSAKMPAGKRTQMFGGADQKLMVGLAALGIGAVVGANLSDDHPAIGALLGAIAGAGATQLRGSHLKAAAKNIAGGDVKRALAMTGAGTAIGYSTADKENKLTGAALGALAVAVARSLPKDTRLRIGTEANARDYAERAFRVEAVQLQYAILDKVSDPARLSAIWKANEPGGSMAGLSTAEREVAQTFRTYYAAMDKAAKAAGVYKEGIDNYMARLHDLSPKDLEFELQKLYEKTGGNGGNPFSKERQFVTLEAAKQAGYTPVTENPVTMLGMYAHSMGKAIADRNFVKALKEKPVPGSANKFVMPEKEAPRDYTPMPGAAMQGMRVHPDLKGSMRFLFESRNPHAVVRAFETVNAAIKRTAVMASLFHAKSLVEAHVGAAKVNKGYILGGAVLGGLTGMIADDPALGGLIGAGLGMLAGSGKVGALAATGTLQALKDLKRGGLTKEIELAMKGGLEFTMEKEPSVVADEGGGAFYAAMHDASKVLDKAVKGSGKVLVDPLIKVNEVFDVTMWARLHTGLKFNTFSEKFNAIKENNARAAEKNPGKVKLLSEDEIAHIAASFANDTFGGINWRRIAEGATTRFGRDIAEWAMGPRGRKVMQIAMFAPDWTISTTRAFLGAFGEGSGLSGLRSPRTLADLHRQYVLRSALYYVLAGDGINYAMSGHHIWDNKDWTRLELGDGRTMQFSKHMMEPYHWMTHPVQQGLNKLSQPVREGLNQVFPTEYLAPRETEQGQVTAGPKMQGSRLGHLAKSMLPISSQASTNTGSLPLDALSMTGLVQIYGKTADQREEEKRRRRLERLMQDSK